MVIPVLDGLHNVLKNSQSGLDVLRAIFIAKIEEKFGQRHGRQTSVNGDCPRSSHSPLLDETAARKTNQVVVAIVENKHGAITTKTKPVPAAAAAPTSTAPNASEALSLPGTGTEDNWSKNYTWQNQGYHKNAAHSNGGTQKKRLYPAVATIARKLLGISASLVLIEHLFSRDVVTKKRNRLDPQKVEMITFITENS